ncbi:hypothetical protein BJ138DRAFT_283961 [Hygrophoropsis aurantiaca]|uniref:Uncharacterized protein n=1 Tax=Hygrophoropsis aurantiaca TaxID=72124 RepID=A0ACB8AU21_9AGAM|nr:hypothetical protein BJ138DRAFT_283961 [Hygrophoropsis aurantiaca]
MPDDVAASATYVRIASTSIAAYDYLRTIPAAWRFYEAQWHNRTFSLSFILFILIRITSITVLILSNIGFFYSQFSLESCQAFFLIPPIFKVLQSMVSQSIMASSIMACYSTMAGRKPMYHPSGVCLATNLDGHHLGTWVYYACCIVYDVITTIISVWFLLKYKMTLSNRSIMSKLANTMLYDGMGYFVLLTVTNTVNLNLYRSSAPIQAAAVTVGYVLTWIMSQKLLINLHDAQMQHRMVNAISTGASITSQNHPRDVKASSSLSNGRSHNIPPSSSRKQDEWTVPEFRCEDEGEDPTHMDVHVRMERVLCVGPNSYGQIPTER